MALQTLSEATPTEAIHWPDVLQRAARARRQRLVEIDGCSRQNSAYRPAHLLQIPEVDSITIEMGSSAAVKTAALDL